MFNIYFTAKDAHVVPGGVFPPPIAAAALMAMMPPPECFHVSILFSILNGVIIYS